MKRKSLLTAIATLLLLAMTACGSKEKKQEGGNETLTLKPATTEISGEMDGCFTVVDRSYKVKMEEFTGGILTVELERTDKPLPFSSEGRAIYSFGSFSQSAYVQVGFGIELLDEDGNIIDKTSASAGGLSGPYSPDECVELVKLSEGKTGSIRFSISKDASEAVSFRITSAYRYGGKMYDSGSADDDVEVIDDGSDFKDTYNSIEVVEDDSPNMQTSQSSGSQDWDSLLDSYERFVDKYVAFYAKVKAGTISITSPEYMEYMQEAAEFAEKAQDAKGSMTAKQAARLNAIVSKLASAIN